MPYQWSHWVEIFYQDDSNVPRTFTMDLGTGRDFFASTALSTVWFGVRTPSSGYGVAADIIDIDGADTPILYNFGANHPNDRATHIGVAWPGTIGDALGRRITFRVRGSTFDSAAVAVCIVHIRQ